jgi:hypothetical protein
MSLASSETLVPIASAEGEEPDSSPVIVETAATQHLRFVLVQDQLHAAAAKVNLLFDMGLTRTSGYTDAVAAYQSKLADFNALRARLGL